MKYRYFFFLAFLLLGSAALAYADGAPVDPRMIVSDPVCGEGCVAVEGTTFSFESDVNGGGFLTFQNVSGIDWFSLLIETGSVPFHVPANTVTCETNAFQHCQVSDLSGGITAMYLSGVTTDGPFGIRNGDVFTIELNDVVGVDGGGWGSFRNFDASANVSSPVPEPATLTLLGVGLGALLAKRRFPRPRDSRA
jgi:hypothetical protein